MKKENRVLQFLTSKKARSYLLIAVLVVALYVVFNLLIGAGVINRYYEGIVRLICINIIMAVSLNLVCGFMGQLALGHAGFMSVGAYAAALFTMNSGLPEAVALPLSLIVGGLFAAVIGFIIGIPALRKIAIHFPIAAFCIVGGSVCQALGKSLYSFFTSVLRQVVALIPAAYLLSLTGNVGNVWWCFPIAEVMSALATTFFLRRALRDMDRQLTLAEGQ